MKKHTYIQPVVTFLLGTILSVGAVPISSQDDPFDYAVRGPDLSAFSIGLYSMQTEREIKWDATGATQVLKQQKVQGYLGVDVLRWLTIYAVGGGSEAKFGDNATADSEGEYGVGFRASLLEHFIKEPVPMEDSLRLNLGGQYTRNSSDDGVGGNVEWNEITAELTLSIVNHTQGHKAFTPESISLYFGPLFSHYMSDDFETEDNMGAVAGMEIFFMDTIILDIEFQHFEETSAGVGINFHF